MSEFTAGILFVKEETPKVQTWLSHEKIDFIIKDINSKWTGLFIADEFLTQPSTINRLLELSKLLPLFHYYYADEHGWGYKVFSQGAEIAALDDDPEYEYRTLEKLVAERYPNVKDIPTFLYFDPANKGIDQTLLNSDEYKHRIATRLDKKNVPAFSLFGLTESEIGRLDEMLTRENLDEESPHSGIEREFKEILDIDEMYYMLYRSMVDEEE
jgi:hypothetical protein